MNRTPLYVSLIVTLLLTPYVGLVFYFSFSYNPLLFSNETLKEKLGFSLSSSSTNTIMTGEDPSDSKLALSTNNKVYPGRMLTFIHSQWKLPIAINENSSSQPAWTLSPDQLFISSNNELKAFDFNKNLIWSFSFENNSNTKEYFFSPVSINEKSLYASTSQGRVYKFNKVTGELIWRLNLNRNLDSPVRYHQGHIYLTQNLEETTQVLKLNSNTGQLIWESKPLSLFQLPQIQLNKKYDLLYGVTNDSIIALNTKNGKVKWESSSQGQLAYPPELTTDRLYMANKEGISLALNAKTGKEVWNFPLDSGVNTPVSFIRDLSRLTVVTEDNYSHIINTATGKRSWRFKLKSFPTGTGFGSSRVQPKTVEAWALEPASQQYVFWVPCQSTRICLKRTTNGQSLAHIDVAGEILSAPLFADNSLFLAYKSDNENEVVFTKFSYRRFKAPPPVAPEE